jgi:hypothetical protein
MECSLAALVLCFSWSNLYIDSSALVWDTKVVFNDGYSDDLNPHGRLAFGLALPFDKATVTFEASHVSSLATTKDKGVNAVSVGVRWFPFR